MQESLSYTQDKKTQTFYFNAQPNPHIAQELF